MDRSRERERRRKGSSFSDKIRRPYEAVVSFCGGQILVLNKNDAACPSGLSGGGGGGSGGGGGHGTVAGAAPCDISTDLELRGACPTRFPRFGPAAFRQRRSGPGIGDHRCPHAPGGRRLSGAGLEPVSRRGDRALLRSPSASAAPRRPACAPLTPTHARLDGARLAGTTDGQALYSLCYPVEITSVPQRTAQPAQAAAATAAASATVRWRDSPRTAVSGGGGGCGMSAAAASRGGGGGAMGDEAGHPSWFTD